MTILPSRAAQVAFVEPTSTYLLGRRENSEAVWQKRNARSPASETSRIFQGLAINFGRLLLVYFMRPPDLEGLGVVRPHGPGDGGTLCPLPPSR